MVAGLLSFLPDVYMASLIHLVKQGGQLPFLDLLLNRTENGGLKLQIYMKPTHTDQYLNFSSHHPIEHKLSVVRTLLERSQCLVTEVDGNGSGNENISNAPPTVDRRRIT